MSPIFKRYLKKEAVVAVWLLFIAALMFFLGAGKVERLMDDVNKFIISEDINADSFDNKEDIEEKIKKLYNDTLYPYEVYYSVRNTKDVMVPDVYGMFENELHNAISMAFLLCCFFACNLTVQAFGDERRKKNLCFVGVLPIKRRRMFAEKWLSGILCITVVCVFSYITLALWANKMCAKAEFISERLLYNKDLIYTPNLADVFVRITFAVYTVYSFLMLWYTLFGTTVYAGLTAATAIAVGLMGMRGAVGFAQMYCDPEVWSVLRTVYDRIEEQHSNTSFVCPVSAVMAAVFFVLGLICDSAARLENIGGIFMYKPVKWLIYAIFMIFGAFAFFFFVVGVCDFESKTLANGIFLLAAGAVLIFFVLKNMLKGGEV